MSRITRNDVAHVAKLARLSVTDEEIEIFTGQLDAILGHAADMETLNLDDLPPTSHPYPLSNVMREDVAGETLSQAEALANAPEAAEGRFKVPTILGESQ